MAAAVIVILYVAGKYAADLVVDQFDFHLSVRTEPMMHRLILLAIACYIILTAIPFMPGIEIGLTMIVFFGAKICFLVYVGTVVALTISYAVGRFIPARYCARAFGYVGMTRAQDMLEQIAPLSADERLAYLLKNAPSGSTPFLLRHRGIALAVALNLPGNFIFGGGGGIAMLAGMTGLFPLAFFLLTVALAVAPVPLIISFTELWRF